MKAQSVDGRNYGIDLLRIVAMMMIPILHVLGHGGILDNSQIYPGKNKIVWLMEIIAYASVNIYGLISGYVGYGRKIKYSNIIYLYFQVLFYTVPTTLLTYIYEPNSIDFEIIKKAIFPFAYNTYWYFSAYFCLFFFMPFLNMVLDKFNRKEMTKLIVCILLMFSVAQTVFYSEYCGTNGGYSFLWLGSLYLIGGYIKKYEEYLPKINYLFGYVICILITWSSKIIIGVITYRAYHEKRMDDYLIKYTSPTIVFGAIFLLLFFANYKCGKQLKKFISFFAPVSFGVYLIHEEPLIRERFISGRFVKYLSLNNVFMIMAIVGTVMIIWLIGSLVDKIRLVLFDVFKVKEKCIWVEKKIMSVININNDENCRIGR